MVQEPQRPGAAWQPGDVVRVRSDQWRVERSQAFGGCELVWLAGVGRANRRRLLTLISPFDRLQRTTTTPRTRRVSFAKWMHAFRHVLSRGTPFGRLRSAAAARIQLHAWQIEPALAMLHGLATRMLLADEVGLGKTIEAGLIVAELRARGRASRTLILTPAGLRDQWMDELRDRFDIEATVVDAALVRRTLSQLAGGTNPWSTWPVIITSLDFVKRTEVLKALDTFTWDLLIVDEAHLCAVAPDRSAALRVLAGRARRLVLVTATPHAGDDRSFVALCGSGAGPQEPPIAMFRRMRRDVGLESTRRVHLLRVRCTHDERRLHQLLERYTRTVWSEQTAAADARLVMVVLRKRALSSAMSLLRSLERRASALFDRPAAGQQLVLPFAGEAEADEQTAEDDDALAGLAAPGMDPRREREWLDRLIDAAGRAAQNESKVSRLQRLLARAREPAIVFTEYRDTARWLTTVLQAAGPLALLHGGLSRRERHDAERAFTTGASMVLIATDAAGEGLNLHQRCRLVVNLELPWNPMRLEQRIGRVDRLGQRRRPHAVHLVARATAEEKIVEHLVVRQRKAERSVGHVADVVGAGLRVSERHVANAVMTGDAGEHESSASPVDCYRTIDLRTLANAEHARLMNLRPLLVGSHAAEGEQAVPRSEVYVASLPTRRLRVQIRRGVRLPAGLLCLFVCRFFATDGTLLEESLVCLHVPGPPGVPDWLAAHRLHAVPSQLLDTVRAIVAERHSEVEANHAREVEAAQDRARCIALRDETVAPQLVQPGMFDRRALKAHDEVLRRACERRLRGSEGESGFATPSSVTVAEPQLALVLVVPVRGTGESR